MVVVFVISVVIIDYKWIKYEGESIFIYIIYIIFMKLKLEYLLYM